MNSHAMLHTALIEKKDSLLEQLDTCHQVMAAVWRFLDTNDEPFHAQTATALLSALRAAERTIDDQLASVRLEMIALKKSHDNEPPAQTTH